MLVKSFSLSSATQVGRAVLLGMFSKHYKPSYFLLIGNDLKGNILRIGVAESFYLSEYMIIFIINDRHFQISHDGAHNSMGKVTLYAYYSYIQTT